MTRQKTNASSLSRRTGAPVWVLVSVVLNLCFLIVIAWQGEQLRQSSVKAHTPSVPERTTEGQSSPIAPSPPEQRSQNVEGKSRAASVPGLDWRRIESRDYSQYVANLRGTGLPEQVVQDIVKAAFRRSFGEDRRVLLRDFGTTYWQTPDQEALAGLALRKQNLDQELTKNLHSLFGAHVGYLNHSTDWQAAQNEQWLDYLPEEKRIQTGEVLLLHRELEEQIKQLAGGKAGDTDPAILQQMLNDQERKYAQLWEILTPTEFKELEMRTSWTADNLRRAMANFHPTEEEYRAIFKAWRAHDEELALIYATSQPDPGNAHVFQEIHEFLGEKRFQEYRRTWWK